MRILPSVESNLLSRVYSDDPAEAPEAVDCPICESERTVEFTGIDRLHGRAEFVCTSCGDVSFTDLWDLED